MTDTEARNAAKLADKILGYFVTATDLDIFEFDDYRADYPCDKNYLYNGYVFTYDDQLDGNILREWARQEMRESALCMR